MVPFVIGNSVSKTIIFSSASENTFNFSPLPLMQSIIKTIIFLLNIEIKTMIQRFSVKCLNIILRQTCVVFGGFSSAVFCVWHLPVFLTSFFSYTDLHNLSQNWMIWGLIQKKCVQQYFSLFVSNAFCPAPSEKSLKDLWHVAIISLPERGTLYDCFNRLALCF